MDKFRVVPAARERAEGQKLRQVTSPEHLNNDTEELDDEELAKALARAVELGAHGLYQCSAAAAATVL